MRRHGFRLAAALAAVIVTGWTTPAAAGADQGSTWFSGPYAHDNLAVYLIHREGADDGPVPLTLDEAMQRGLIEVIETGVVAELVVRNTGDSEVFLQSGDIFKGGKQDRVLITSMIVPPRSGDLSVNVFCVESGRWSARWRGGSELVLAIHGSPAVEGRQDRALQGGAALVRARWRSCGLDGRRESSEPGVGVRRRGAGGPGFWPWRWMSRTNVLHRACSSRSRTRISPRRWSTTNRPWARWPKGIGTPSAMSSPSTAGSPEGTNSPTAACSANSGCGS